MFLERDEMKFAILYTLRRNVEPMNMANLCEVLTWEKEVMGYFDLAVMLNELLEDGYVIRKYYRNDEAFTLSEKGTDTNEFFFERVPKSIRERIKVAIAQKKYDEQIDPNAVTAEIIPVAQHQYMASLQMLEANRPILELRIEAGHRAEAEKMAKSLKQNAAAVYAAIMKLLDGESET